MGEIGSFTCKCENLEDNAPQKKNSNVILHPYNRLF